MSKTIAILGSTGSIGRQTLDVAEQLGLNVAAITANSSVERMEEQARRFRPDLAVLTDEAAARDLAIRLADTKDQGRRRLCRTDGGGNHTPGRYGGHRRGWHGGPAADSGCHRGEKAHRPGQQGDTGLRGAAGDGRGQTAAVPGSFRWTASTPLFSSACRAAGTGGRSSG